MKTKPVKDIYIFLVLIGLTFAIRWPSFFPSSINWDEGTFILIGQDVLNGHLPYTELWDVKPPLLFFAFAAIIAICGKSIVLIRIVGSLFLATATFLVYKFAKYLGNTTTGLIAATLFVIMTGEAEGKAVMSEILAVVPLTAAFLVMITQKKDTPTHSYFLLGFLLSLATLIRLNLAYLDLVVFIYYLFLFIFQRQKNSLINLIYFNAGIFIPIVLVIIPYILTDNLLIFYKSVIEASLSYSTSQVSKAAVTSHFITRGLLTVNWILWGGFFGSIILIIRKIIWTSNPSQNYLRRNLLLLLLWLIAIGFSIASSGNVYAHYLIQILPFMTTSSGLFFSAVPHLLLLNDSGKSFDKLRYTLLALLAIGLLDFAHPMLTEQITTLFKLKNGISLQDDEGYQVADFLRKADPQKEPVYMMDFEIVHWLTDIKLIDNIVAHPSTIGKNYLLKVIISKDATAESEMAKILNKKPLFIIKTQEILYLDSQPEAKNLLLTTLKQKYRLVSKIKSLYVYKRLS